MQSIWKRPLAVALITILMLVMLAPHDAGAQGRSNNGSLTLPITGTGKVDPNDPPESAIGITGTFTINRFERQGADVMAIGTLVARRADTGTVGVQQVAMRVHQIVQGSQGSAARQAGPAVVTQAVCDILTLVLGPLHLDLLGLVVDLNQVVLEITAVSGAGNLLGNLLCAIAGLLDPSGLLEGLAANILNQISQLLNRLLGAL